MGHGLDISDSQNCPCAFWYMIKLSKYDTFYTTKSEPGDIFFITLGHGVNQIWTNPRTFVKFTLCTLARRKNRKDIYNNVWVESTEIFRISSQMKLGKIAFEVMQALFRLWALPVSSVTSILQQNLHANKQILLVAFPLSLRWSHANVRNKSVEKYIILCVASEKTPPQSSWPITALATMGWQRQNVWLAACAMIYRCNMLYCGHFYRIHKWQRQLDKIATIFQTTFSNAFSWQNMFKLWPLFQLILFLRVQFTTTQHWFR